MDIGYILIILGVILVSMTLHEAMHGFMAYWLGDDTAKDQGRLTLNPIRHIDPFLTILLPLTLAAIGAPIFGGAKPVPFNPSRVRYGEWGAAMVAAAGPVVNLLLAFIAFGVLAISVPEVANDLKQLMVVSDLSLMTNIILQFILVNLGFFAFNVLPIPPLDGSRVIYALAPDFVRRGMEAIESYGIIFVFLIVLVASSAIGSIMTAIISLLLKAFSLIIGL